jgi:alpha-ketoglutarate-dependent taurine dioxygenase
LLFRGFSLSEPTQFRVLAESLTDGLQPYVGGDSPRSRILGHVYTSTEFPPDLRIDLHNELSYTKTWPNRVLFFCLVPPASGGETPIADGREVYSRITPSVRERFAEKGVAYTQRLRDRSVRGPGKSWQDTFETDDPSMVDERCRASGVQWSWTERGLCTTTRCPGVLAHPHTGERVWFNQADQWHAGMRSAKHLPGTYTGGSHDPPCHATYGDGTEIAVEDLHGVRVVYDACEVSFQWQHADVLLLDNVLAAHGRNAYSGERRILVSMG